MGGGAGEGVKVNQQSIECSNILEQTHTSCGNDSERSLESDHILHMMVLLPSGNDGRNVPVLYQWYPVAQQICRALE